MTDWVRQAQYEVGWIARSSHLRLALLGTLLVAAGVAAVVSLAADQYLEPGVTRYWALVATQGGAGFRWPPFFGYLLAIYGVLVWASDARGEGAFATYLSFPRRSRTAIVRTAGITIVAATTAVLVLGISVLVALGTGTAPPVDGLERLVVIKAVWLVICSVALAQIGAALCVVLRSPRAAMVVLLVLPWIVEPIAVQMLALIPALERFEQVGAYFPFRVAAAALGDRPDDFAITGASALAPSSAAVVLLGISGVAALLVQWRYCTADGMV